MRTIWKDLALLFAGALASVLGGIVFKPDISTRYLFLLIFAVLLLILFGSGAMTYTRRKARLWRREGFWFLKPKIGILNDMGWDKANTETYSWTDVGPEGWKELLKSHLIKSAKISLINSDKHFDSYIAVLNPYGGVYPEADLKTSQTLNKIFDYVNKGGNFVNVADIPGYWAYNQLLKRRLDATPAIYRIGQTEQGNVSITSVRPFIRTPFMERLGLQVYATEKENLRTWTTSREDQLGEPFQITVHRVALVEKNVVPFINLKECGSADVTPLFRVNYGEGRFLISLLFQGPDSENADKIKEIVVLALIDLIGDTIKSNLTNDASKWPFRTRCCL
jgi:hypothetical protein